MRALGLVVLLFAASNGICQTAAKDPDTVQALLVEVRQLRQDIEAMTLASQRVQIALYGLQMQDAAVARSARRLDDARNSRTQAEDVSSHLSEEVRKLEAAMTSSTLIEAERKSVEERLTQLKSEADRSNIQLQSRQAAEAEASSQFRTDQAKLTETQDRIERLDKVLEKMASGGK